LRTIFINRFFHPDHSATSQILSDLAFGLAEGGMQVTVITSRLSYDGRSENLKPQESIGGVDIQRVWTTHFGRSRLKFRAIDYLTFLITAAWALLRIATRSDIIVAMTDPPMLSILSAPIAKLRGAHIVNWLQDLFPEVAEALFTGGKLSRFLFACLRQLRNLSLRYADMNVAIGELMAERLLRAGIPGSRVSVLPNWADCESLIPVASSDNPLRTEWDLPNHFVVGYSGNLGRAHEFETLLAAIETIERANVRLSELSIKWLFIGGGHAFECMRAETINRGLSSVVFRPYQPRQLLSQSLSASDVHIVTLRPELEGLIVPSKFYGAAAAGRPILFIGSHDGEIARLTERHSCGLSIVTGDSTALANAVLTLARDPQRVHDMGTHARTSCKKFYAKSLAISAWTRMLRAISKSQIAYKSLPSTPQFNPDKN
jgi:glycosyltransferase involved in cell wall biosynthesis